jgi:hypothetical protein
MSLESTHNDYLDPDRHMEPEPTELDTKRRDAGLRIMRELSAENWGKVYRALYKGTSCGVTVGVLFAGADKPEYCDDLYRHGKDSWPVQIHVSSIVESVDECTATHIVDLGKPSVVKALFAACDAVEKEAGAIWDDTHGCEKCAEMMGFHNGREECAGRDGITPVQPKCKKCGGTGVVI